MSSDKDTSYLEHAYLAPVTVAILIPSMLGVCYVWAAYIEHDVKHYLPYISETYDDAPQAVFYTQMTNLIVLVLVISCIFRYIQIDTILTNEACTCALKFDYKQVRRLKTLNKLGFLFAMIFCTAILFLSSTRLNEMYIYHYILAFTVFTSAPVMYVLQAWVAFKFRPILTSHAMAYARLIITILSVADIIVFTVARCLAKGREDKHEVRTFHVIAAHAEYIFVLLVSPFAITYVSEFRRLRCVKSAEFVYHFDTIINTHSEETRF